MKMKNFIGNVISGKMRRRPVESAWNLSDWNEKNFEMTMHEIKECNHQYIVEENTRGYSYEKIFGDYFYGTKNILIEDPYIWKEFKIQNFKKVQNCHKFQILDLGL